MSNFLTRQPWFETLRRAFWSDPDRLLAIKATFVIGFLATPLVVLGHPFLAVSLSLGALAGALSETDDHPRGRIKSLALKVFCFGLSTLSVELLSPYPILLGLGLSASTILFLLLGGLSERYRGVTFGAILVGIYAMIGHGISPAWYWQPLLLPGGALIYGLFSLLLLFLHPWRLLEEQLARGFVALAKYLELKARLFPSDEKVQATVRHQLALQNVALVGALDHCKEVLNSYRDALPNDEPIARYFRYFMLLQSLHERAASSHERYDRLSGDPHNEPLMEGIGQTLRQLAGAVRQFSTSLLTGVPYAPPVSLRWLVQVLNEQLARHPAGPQSSLHLLVDNLSRSHRALENLSDEQIRTITPRLAREDRSVAQRLRDQLNWDNPRMRYAIRLSVCFLLGFVISEAFQVRKGEWIILTCLFVLQPTYSATRRRLFQRILGTASGVVGGVLLIQVLPTTAGQTLFMLASAFAFFAWLKRNYAISVVFITTFVLGAFSLVSNEAATGLMLPRLIDTLIGSFLALLSVRLLWPDWQYKRLPHLLSAALNRNADYLTAILREYEQTWADDDLDYRIARRAAHRADNALVLAWQNMQVEPRKRRRFLDQAFALTYLNHALLSYISAFAAHRRHPEATSATVLERAREILSALQAATQAETPTPTPERPDLERLLKRLRADLNEAAPGIGRQQLTLLDNIAQVTTQIDHAARTLRAHHRPDRAKSG